MGVVGAAHNDGLVVHQALDACRERRWGAGGKGDEGQEGGVMKRAAHRAHTLGGCMHPSTDSSHRRLQAGTQTAPSPLTLPCSETAPPPLTLLGHPVDVDSETTPSPPLPPHPASAPSGT